jgi:DMSO/TMAO reductase YedYZ molybdopterin-dependent catalytic subunit
LRGRREFLAWTAAIPFSALGLAADEETIPFEDYGPDFRVDAQPENPHVKCFDLRRLTDWVTPAAEFFGFHQSRTPQADPGAWRLRIGGLVKRPKQFTLAELQNRPGQRDAAVTIECSGNTGDPRIMNGLVSNAVWTGVGLAPILAECGIEPAAREVVFLGMDAQEDRKFEAGNTSLLSPHGRSLFVQDATAPDPLLAFAMNGEPLDPEHGYPLRLVLPGWYGVAQVKWLTRIEVIDRRYEGRHMSRNYQSLHAIESPDGSFWLDTSISRNNLKSVVARVTRRRVGSGFAYRVLGAAWGGPAPVRSVEVQVDGGPWRMAAFDRHDNGDAWSLWSCDWKDAAPGLHTLVSRATNARGEIQPTRAELRAKLMSNREDNSQWQRSVRIEAPA